MNEPKLVFSNNVAKELDLMVTGIDPRGGVFVICDTNTSRCVVKKLKRESAAVAGACIIEIEAGDINKTVATLNNVWQQLSQNGGTRRSLIINIGGGVVTDLGGMAAATFKRGIPFINVPTTLLGAVDAAVGGKTGVNLGGLKNEVGVFAHARGVIISTCFFDTLPDREIMSGYAEMVKHSLLSDEEEFKQLLSHDPLADTPETLLNLLKKSVLIKETIVAADPTEQGLRRVLNLGHTAGHAFETLMMERSTPIAHGHAVALGLAMSLILSHLIKEMDSAVLTLYIGWLKEHYPLPDITCRDYDRVAALMGHDKKNEKTGEVAFVLLERPGKPVERTVVEGHQLRGAFDLFLDLTGY